MAINPQLITNVFCILAKQKEGFWQENRFSAPRGEIQRSKESEQSSFRETR